MCRDDEHVVQEVGGERQSPDLVHALLAVLGSEERWTGRLWDSALPLSKRNSRNLSEDQGE